jgi:hypothetical protein
VLSVVQFPGKEGQAWKVRRMDTIPLAKLGDGARDCVDSMSGEDRYRRWRLRCVLGGMCLRGSSVLALVRGTARCERSSSQLGLIHGRSIVVLAATGGG